MKKNVFCFVILFCVGLLVSAQNGTRFFSIYGDESVAVWNYNDSLLWLSVKNIPDARAPQNGATTAEVQWSVKMSKHSFGSMFGSTEEGTLQVLYEYDVAESNSGIVPIGASEYCDPTKGICISKNLPRGAFAKADVRIYMDMQVYSMSVFSSAPGVRQIEISFKISPFCRRVVESFGLIPGKKTRVGISELRYQ